MIRKVNLFKIVLLCCVLAICTTVLLCCGKNIETETFISGEMKEIVLTASSVEYDFQKGVVFLDSNGNNQEFSVDYSNVKFGVAGEYSVIYDVQGVQYERKVKIYGEPKIEVKNSSVAYKDAIDGVYDSYVVASDTFGEKLEFKCISNLSVNKNGQVETGKQNLKFTATDKYGNTAVKELTLNILNSNDTLRIPNLTIDYSSPYYTIEIGNRRVFSAYIGEQKLSTSDYMVNNGYLMMTPTFITKIGVGNMKTVYINMNTISLKFNVSVTDNKPLAYEFVGDINDENFYLDDLIKLPYVRLTNGSIQNAEFCYYMEYNGQKDEIFKSDYNPEKGGEYKFITEIYKDGQLEETVNQTFNVSHYNKNPIGLFDYIALGVENDISLKTDLAGVPIQYVLKNNTDNVLELKDNILVGKKEGTATVSVNINNGEIKKDINVSVIDYLNGQGKVKDISSNPNLWKNTNGLQIVTNKVSDIRTTEKKYEQNALTVKSGTYLPEGIIYSAKLVGYKYLTFYLTLGEGQKEFSVNACDEEGVKESGSNLLTKTNDGRWTYYSIPLSNVKTGQGIRFDSDVTINLAKVEFVGADISMFASNYIKASATEGKSTDLILNDTINSMFLSTCNTNNSFSYTNTGMDRVATGDNGDYFTYNRSGYHSSYGATENDVYINSEWLMSAKKLGYSTIGIWIKGNSGYSFLKRKADGTLQEFKNNGASWHGAVTVWSFISLDLSTFEEGDVIIFSVSDESVKISGVTFRTSNYGTPNLLVG